MHSSKILLEQKENLPPKPLFKSSVLRWKTLANSKKLLSYLNPSSFANIALHKLLFYIHDAQRPHTAAESVSKA